MDNRYTDKLVELLKREKYPVEVIPQDNNCFILIVPTVVKSEESEDKNEVVAVFYSLEQIDHPIASEYNYYLKMFCSAEGREFKVTLTSIKLTDEILDMLTVAAQTQLLLIKDMFLNC